MVYRFEALRVRALAVDIDPFRSRAHKQIISFNEPTLLD
jgi:hypothetical protein